MDELQVRSRLEECLLTDEEFAAGAEFWKTFQDSLPDWEHELAEAESEL